MPHPRHKIEKVVSKAKLLERYRVVGFQQTQWIKLGSAWLARCDFRCCYTWRVGLLLRLLATPDKARRTYQPRGRVSDPFSASYDAIAACLGIPLSGVRTAIRELVAVRFIVTRHSGGRAVATIFYICDDPPLAKERMQWLPWEPRLPTPKKRKRTKRK